ncbi:MAG: hypothetical protein K2O67_05515 [Clostridia bacterium]|nr:hypothetical protein [Clostridia bacterium]
MDGNFLRTARVTRLGKLFCNVSLFGGTLLLLLGLMPIIKVVYYILAAAIALAVLAFWLISLITFHPFDLSFLNTIFSGEVVFAAVQEFALSIAPYLGAIVLLLGAISIPLILRDKSKKPTGRIVAASLAMGFAVIGIIALYLAVLL